MIDERDVYAQLGTVLDPELDQSLTALGFIERVEIAGDTVEVRFRLPTYWCAPNFAYLMASDIRERVGQVVGVRKVAVRLVDHFADDEVSDGINAGKSFTDVFPGDAEAELDELRHTFARKAFLVRQEQLLRALLRAGFTPSELASLHVEDARLDANTLLIRIPESTADDWQRIPGLARTFALWRQKRIALGLRISGETKLFTTAEGEALTPDGVLEHLRAARMVRLNGVFNTMLCTGLNAARHGVPIPDIESSPESLCSERGAAGT